MNYQTEVQLRKVPVKKIRNNPCQGGRRTAPARLRKLESSARAHGISVPPLLDASLTVIDGHRRIAVLVALGQTEILCLVERCRRPPERIITVNAVDRHANRDKLENWANVPRRRTHALSVMDSACRSRIEQLIRIFGEKRLAELVATHEKLTPSLYDTIRDVRAEQFRLCEDKVLSEATIGAWALKHNLHGWWNKAKKTVNRRRIEALTKCIGEDAEMNHDDWDRKR